MAVTGFAVLDNHLHVLVRLDPDVAKGWSDEDVVRRWGHLFPPQDRARQVAPVSEDWVQARLKDAKWIATARERLQSLSWFMKCLKLIDALESRALGLPLRGAATRSPGDELAIRSSYRPRHFTRSVTPSKECSRD